MRVLPLAATVSDSKVLTDGRIAFQVAFRVRRRSGNRDGLEGVGFRLLETRWRSM